MGALQLVRRRFAPVVVGLLALILLLVWALGDVGGGSSADGRSIVPTSSATATAGPTGTIAYDDLPAEAHRTLALIADGGPYPYEDDGIVFENREGLLPHEDSGFYHEFTVETPGEDDRGARRIVRADDGTLYYTDDHYQSFRRIVP